MTFKQNKMSKTFNKGGQRRTIEAGCGWRCVGHPTEVNKKFILHKKYCKFCGSHTDLPDFDKTAGNMNGWKGHFHNNNSKKETISYVSVNGKESKIHLEGVKRTDVSDKIEEKILSDAELIALFEIPPSKKGKK